MVVSRAGSGPRGERKEAKMHDHSAQLEVLRHHREELLEEAENARLGKEIRRRRREASREWRINLGRWILQLRRLPEYSEYGASHAAKG